MRTLGSGTNFARYALGDLVVVALRDGFVDMPPSRLRLPGNRAFGADLPAEVELVDGRLRLSVNAFLVIDHGQHILIDTGAADAWLPTMGLLLRALDGRGWPRRHPDGGPHPHARGPRERPVAADGSDAFPNLDRHLLPPDLPGQDAEPANCRFFPAPAARSSGLSALSALPAGAGPRQRPDGRRAAIAQADRAAPRGGP